MHDLLTLGGQGAIEKPSGSANRDELKGQKKKRKIKKRLWSGRGGEMMTVLRVKQTVSMPLVSKAGFPFGP